MDVLDLDCLPNDERRKRIEAWHNSMTLIIATDTMDVLDLDCLLDDERRKRIEACHNSMTLIIATDTTLSDDFSLVTRPKD